MSNAAKWAHRFCVTLSTCTLFLIFIGGLVKTTESGLAVPDWPLSYGKLMPPMIGGILFEHGHRMAATLVGFLMVTAAFLLTFIDDRAWIKKAGWAGVGLVVFQGVLGGLTVLFRLPKSISIAHAFTAQTFFCLTVALATWTSRFWRSEATPRQEPANTIALNRIGLALVGLCFLQLLFGATVRHTGYAFPFHIVGAVLVVSFAGWFHARVGRDQAGASALGRISLWLMAALVLQIALGVVTYLLVAASARIRTFSFLPVMLITLHVMIGALVLGLSVLATLVAHRTRPLHSTPLKTTLADYFTLTKPGISFMAGITALAGFVLGSREALSYTRLFHTCLGTLFAAAGAGCLNMFIEKDLDARMKRTRERPLPAGRLQPGEVFFLGVFCSCASVLYLAWAVNYLTAFFAALTLSVYLYVYTPLKKISGVCVTVGAVAGALPPVIGWTAATGRLGVEALALFGILFFWQFPHFLSLAWLYKDDYAEAQLHMLPNSESSDRATGRQILINSVFLFLVSCLPTFLGLTGLFYLLAAIGTGITLLYYSHEFFKDTSRPQARRVFLFSLVYIPLLVVLMLLDGVSVV